MKFLISPDHIKFNELLINVGQALTSALLEDIKTSLFSSKNDLKRLRDTYYSYGYSTAILESILINDSEKHLLDFLNTVIEIGKFDCDCEMCELSPEQLSTIVHDHIDAVDSFINAVQEYLQKNNPLLNNEFIETHQIATFVDDYHGIIHNFNNGKIDFNSAKASLEYWQEAIPQAVFQYSLLVLMYGHIKNQLEKKRSSI